MARSQVIYSLGWFNHQNCGDEMFKDVIPTFFRGAEKYPIFKFINNLQANIKAINAGADLLIIGGGNIISESFLSGLKDIKVPYSFLGVGITEQKDAHLLSGAEQVFVRDQRSYDFITDKTIDKYLIPDLAFSMEANKDRGKALLYLLPKVNPNKLTIGLFLNDCVNTVSKGSILKFVEYHRVVLELARFLEGLNNYNIVFIPMSFAPPDDRRMSLDVIGNMTKGYNCHCIVNPLTPRDCLDLTSALDVAITMRLHADIFCTIANTPFIDLVHHSKNKSYLDTYDLTDLSIDYYGLNQKVLKEKVSDVLRRTFDVKEKLLGVQTNNKLSLLETMKCLSIIPGKE